MTDTTALPTAEPSATVSDQPLAELNQEDTSAQQHDKGDGDANESDAQPEHKEKTPEQREISRLQRAMDRRTKKLAEAQALLAQYHDQRSAPQHGDDRNTSTPAENDVVTIPRGKFDALVNERAKELAPQIKREHDEIDHRQGIVKKLVKEWGEEKFNTYAAELEDAFDGLRGSDGRPKPATDAIFESDMPSAIIEYLSDPENADEAAAIGQLNAVKAGRAVAKLELKLEAKRAQAKPQASKAPKPLEEIRGGGKVNGMPDPSNVKAYIKWANERDRRS